MKLTLPFDRLVPLLRSVKLPTSQALAMIGGLSTYLRKRVPGLFYDPSRHYMRGPGPKASLKGKSPRGDSQTT
jgi:hypothetical protein